MRVEVKVVYRLMMKLYKGGRNTKESLKIKGGSWFVRMFKVCVCVCVC